MRRFEMPTPTRRRSATQHRARRTARFALRCEHLESRQLLSIGQTGLTAGVLASHFVPVAEVASPPAASSVGVSSDSSSAAKSGTPGGLNDGQVGFLLNEFVEVGGTATQSAAILGGGCVVVWNSADHASLHQIGRWAIPRSSWFGPGSARLRVFATVSPRAPRSPSPPPRCRIRPLRP
jgi:hypothetical protein